MGRLNERQRTSLVIVAPELGRGGSVSEVALRHAALLRDSFDVHLISRSMPADLPSQIGCTVVQPRSWNWLRRFGHVPNELAFIASVRQALLARHAQRPIDAVWCHSHSLAALAADPLHAQLGFRLVLTAHGEIFDRPTGTYSRDLTAFYRWVTPRAYRACDAIQVLSPNMKSLAVQHGAPFDRTHVIPHGIDVEEIGLTAHNPNQPPATPALDGERAIRLLYAGRLSTEKGVDVLLRAAALLAATGVRFELTIVGSGPLQSALANLTSQLNLMGHVQFAGSVARETLGMLYRSADIVCVPSLSEPFGMVALEAMAAGTAIVGSTTGGIPFIVQDGVCGLLTPPGDSAALAQALSKLASDATLRREMGRAGQERARTAFRWDDIAVQIAESLLGIPGAVTPGPVIASA